MPLETILLTQLRMAVKKVLFLIVPIILLTSCDMSRWYFRHGGKHQSEKSSLEHPQTTSFKQPEYVHPIMRDTVLSFTEDVVITHPENTSNEPVTTVSESRSSQPEMTFESQKQFPENTYKKETAEHNHSASTQRMHTNAGPLILLLILVFILGLAMIGALIFLISWIFVPVAIALRIALWGLLIAFGVYLLLFLGLILFSD